MISSIVRYIKKGRFSSDIVYEKIIEGSKGNFKPVNIIESDSLKSALSKMGIDKLYSHQAEAYLNIRLGKNVLITTPTASGKTLCYNLPIVEDILSSSCKALYLFPMKALGYDQKKKLDELLSKFDNGIKCAVIDGDTDKKSRRKILQDNPDIIISNVDVLHYSILPKLDEWNGFLSKLKYVVCDELHIYRGIFGAHVRNIFLRLKRLKEDFQIIASSATIGNAKDFVKSLFDDDFVLIDKSGAVTNRKYFLFFNPEISPMSLGSYLLKILIESGVKTLCFTKSRFHTESIYRRLVSNSGINRNTISSYRAGFLPEERRLIEQSFRKGDLKGVISTSAFELGIDIGGVDATVLVGFPGSLMSLWQRAGRSGRDGRDSLIILIAGRDALDQYFVKNPELLFTSKYEDAVVDIKNTNIISQHIHCAAFEKPISTYEYFYHSYENEIGEMVRKRELFFSEDKTCIVTLRDYPHKNVDLRNAGETYSIIFQNRIIGTNSKRKSYLENYKGAIYYHRGETFKVKEIDDGKREIYVEPVKSNYYTSPLIEKDCAVLQVFSSKEFKRFLCKYVELEVKEQLVGYERISEKSGEKLGKVEMRMEPINFVTKGVVLELPAFLESKGLMGKIHAIEHAFIGIIPTQILCDRNDLGGISYPIHFQTNRPSIFIYDGFPGGIGIARRVFDNIENILQKTFDNIDRCDCDSGCPGCIISPKCGSGNYPLDKYGALELLRALLFDEKGFVDERDEAGDVIVFDVETKFSATDVGGWKNAHKMGVAVLVAYSLKEKKHFVFFENEIEKFKKLLEQAVLIIGFNIINFDYKVLSKYFDVSGFRRKSFDLLEDIRKIAGKRYSLNNIASATLGVEKSADGLQSLKWVKNGEIDKVVEYCKKDVDITYKIFDYGVKHDAILCEEKGVKISIPVKWKEILKDKATQIVDCYNFCYN